MRPRVARGSGTSWQHVRVVHPRAQTSRIAMAPKEFLRVYLVMLVFANVAWCVVTKLTRRIRSLIRGFTGLRRGRRGRRSLCLQLPQRTLLLFFVFPDACLAVRRGIRRLRHLWGDGGGRGSHVAYAAHVAGAAFALIYYQFGWNLRAGARSSSAGRVSVPSPSPGCTSTSLPKKSRRPISRRSRSDSREDLPRRRSQPDGEGAADARKGQPRVSRAGRAAAGERARVIRCPLWETG